MKTKDQYLSSIPRWKVGDKVKLTQSARSHQNGWRNNWSPLMDQYIGKERKINSLDTGLRFGVNFGEAWIFDYPYFASNSCLISNTQQKT